MHTVFDGFVAELVCCSVGEAALHAATREPDGKAVMVVIAARGSATADWNLDGRSAAKLTSADDKGFVEQASLSQIEQQCGDRAVALVAKLAMLAGDIAVRVPWLDIAVITLDHTNSAFN